MSGRLRQKTFRWHCLKPAVPVAVRLPLDLMTIRDPSSRGRKQLAPSFISLNRERGFEQLFNLDHERMLTAAFAQSPKVVDDQFLPLSLYNRAAMCQILFARFLYPAQEHECMCPIDSDPNLFLVKFDAEVSRFQRYVKIVPSFKRRVSESPVGSGGGRIDPSHRLPGFPVFPLLSVIRILAHFDAPSRRLWAKKKTPALINRETTRHDSFGVIDKCLAGLGS